MERLAADPGLKLRDNFFSELVTDKGYHSNDTMTVFREVGDPDLQFGTEPRAAQLEEQDRREGGGLR